MAEAIARRDAADKIEASSAGLAPLGFIAAPTVHILETNGYSADDLHSKAISQEAWDSADLIVNMSGVPLDRVARAFSSHRDENRRSAGDREEPTRPRVEDWPVHDPYGSDPQEYQAVFEDIRERIADLAARLSPSDGERAAVRAAQPRAAHKTDRNVTHET
jgi:protein-tyrosine-phosphatase